MVPSGPSLGQQSCLNGAHSLYHATGLRRGLEEPWLGAGVSWLFSQGNGNAAGLSFPLAFPTCCSCIMSSQQERAPLRGLCAQALVILKGGCSPRCWRWPGFKPCVETVTVSPLLGRTPVPHTVLSEGDGQEELGGCGSDFSVERRPG